ncbi:hypothetical protein C0216_32335 (plasmid) [Streptomyces globosus]|uniref:Uncharacterized protein n=1 Tax=Streptomyces globosus TaxID=68209 RepID=A0A344UBA6_9ACTN|nr:hypothetical protein C0216_32335 [Streptomyces globosus]
MRASAGFVPNAEQSAAAAQSSADRAKQAAVTAHTAARSVNYSANRAGVGTGGRRSGVDPSIGRSAVSTVRTGIGLRASQLHGRDVVSVVLRHSQGGGCQAELM